MDQIAILESRAGLVVPLELAVVHIDSRLVRMELASLASLAYLVVASNLAVDPQEVEQVLVANSCLLDLLPVALSLQEIPLSLHRNHLHFHPMTRMMGRPRREEEGIGREWERDCQNFGQDFRMLATDILRNYCGALPAAGHLCPEEDNLNRSWAESCRGHGEQRKWFRCGCQCLWVQVVHQSKCQTLAASSYLL